jgi:hypothetical protein
MSSHVSPSEDFEDVARMLGEDLQRLDDEADAILDSIRNETFGSDEHVTVDHSSDDEGDDQVADEINDEILRLGTVIANIKQDLDEVSVESMTSALSNRDPGHYRYQQKTLALDSAGDFLRENKLYGPGVGGETRNWPLLFLTVSIWGVLVLLVLHVKYGAMDDNGNVSLVPASFNFR